MTLPLTPTETLALAQGVRRNEERYERLRTRPDAGAADYVVLTATNQRQAAAYRMQIEERIRSRFFPAGTRVLVVPDPEGRRIGSGGATLHALRAVARDIWKRDRDLLADAGSGADPFLGRRILVLHSGGDSRRMPHCAASGKIFAELAVEAVGHGAATVFDALFVILAGVLERLGPGLLVASGDVLPVFDVAGVRPAADGVTGFAMAAPAEQAVNHGVYIIGRGGVRSFLHKESEDVLRARGALDALGRAWIDTGLVAFAGAGLRAAADLAGIRLGPQRLTIRPALLPAGFGDSLDLYDDLLPALAPDADRDAYVAHAPSRRVLREGVWSALHGREFRAQRFSPAQFIHLGTTAEYLEAIAEGGAVRSLFRSRPVLGSYLRPNLRADQATIVGSHLGDARGEVGSGAMVQGARVAGALSLAPGSLLSGVRSRETDLHLHPGVVLHQIPVRFPADYPDARLRGTSAFATYLFGVRDNPKGLLVEGACTLCGTPAGEWLERHRVDADVVWQGVAPAERCLWNARLFPVTPRGEDLNAVLWMQEDEAPSDAERRSWEEAPRLSLAEMARMADSEALVTARRDLAAELRAIELRHALSGDVPAAEIVAGADLFSGAVDTRAALDQMAAVSAPLLRARVHFAHARLLDALAERESSLPAALLLRQRADAREEAAFAAVSEVLGATEAPADPAVLGVPVNEEVAVALPVRVDFGGGWSDTPPHSLERGGTVLNCAVLLAGDRPVRATVRALPAAEIRLETRDLGVRLTLRRKEDALSYQDPSDPFALHKAALVQAGIVRSGPLSLRACLDAFGGGVEVVTQSAVPKGSGLGTSSILGACLVMALRRLCGRPDAPDIVYNEVLRLEQMLTTGGGWQDQVGGVLPGIKLVTSKPGVPQCLEVEQVTDPPAVLDALQQRLVLVYVGYRRLAKNILRVVMGGYLERNPDSVYILGRIQEIAREMREALPAGDLERFGALMAEHWELNKRLDPNSTNKRVEAVLSAAAPYAAGYKMVGAGGGGFAEILARDAEDAGRIAAAVAAEGGVVYPWAVAL